MGYRILLVNLHPVEYVPKSGRLCYFENIRLEVEVASERNPSPFNGDLQQLQIVKDMVDNPEVLETYPKSEPFSTYEYVIITNEELNSTPGPHNFQALRDDKLSRGISATIVTVEWIYANHDGTRPDGGEDNQTKIRNFIINASTSWGTRFVLLGGDGDGGDVGGESGDIIIPHRGFASVSGEIDYDIPADMYYSCLDGTFDYDGDGLYGEPDDGPSGGEVDLFAEVFVGRACVDSQSEVQNFVRKTLSYQTTTGLNLRKVWMVGEYVGFGGVAEWGGNYKDEIKEGSDAHGYATVGFENSPYSGRFDVATLYDRDYPGNNWPVSEVVDVINDNVHLINHLGHANVGYMMKMNNFDVDTLLVNDDVYFIGYSQGCYCGAFDDRTSYGSYTSEDCISEHFTTEAYGAVAFIANSRYGWGEFASTDGPSQHYDREFWDAVFGEDIFEIGVANQDSKEDNAGRVSDPIERYCYYEINLFGDPELRIRLAPIPEHELDVDLEAPDLLKLGNSSVLNASVCNRGRNTEVDVELFLFINGTVVGNVTATELENGTCVQIDNLWTPTAAGVYNITAYAPPVPGENFTNNNWVTKIATVVTPPPDTNWILFATDPDEGVGTNLKAIYGQVYSNAMYFKLEQHRPWTTITDINIGIFLDADQSSSTGLPDGYYPNQNTGTGADYVMVIGFEATEMWRWDPLTLMWDIYNPIPFTYLEVHESPNRLVVGVNLADVETEGTLDCAVADTMSDWDWMPDSGFFTFPLVRYEHELSLFLETPWFLQPGETSILNVTVHNIGLNNETDVEIQLLVNGTEEAGATLDELVNGTWYILNYSWTPTIEGTYNITAYAPPVPGENVTMNNVVTQIVLVQTLPDIIIVSDDDGSSSIDGTSIAEFESALTAVDYDYWVWSESSMGSPPLDFLTEFQLVIWTCGDYWSWAVDPLDAANLKLYLAQGGNLLLEGEDIGYDHFADDFMVNVAHAIQQIDDTGAPGLTVTDTNHPVTLYLPTSFSWLTDPPYDDGVSPTNGGTEVIQYTGTSWTAVTVFEGSSNGSVVYYSFPLLCLAESQGETLAINSINWLLGIRYEHELVAFLDAPMFLAPGDPTMLNATVYNWGVSNETDVRLQLRI
ncbi:MAG: hypothetical protein JSV35_02185, partial [Candidatus Bathyarchaeota archaeon]